METDTRENSSQIGKVMALEFYKAVHKNDFSNMDTTKNIQITRRKEYHTNSSNSKDTRRFPPLHYPASCGDVRMTEYLLDHGADMDSIDNHGNTALMWATKKGHLQVISSLVSYGANINQQNFSGETPLFLAIAFQNREDIVEYLLDNGANINSSNLRGETALHYAVALNKPEYVYSLVSKYGAWLESEDEEGDTPLHVAVRENRLELAEFLLASGADSNHLNEDDESPHDLATILGESRMVVIMESHQSERERHLHQQRQPKPSDNELLPSYDNDAGLADAHDVKIEISCEIKQFPNITTNSMEVEKVSAFDNDTTSRQLPLINPFSKQHVVE